MLLSFVILAVAAAVQAEQAPLSGPMVFGGFRGELSSDGSYRIEGDGWPALVGTYSVSGSEIDLEPSSASECEDAARYHFQTRDGRMTLSVVQDACTHRRMILDRSIWRPEGASEPLAERAIVLSPGRLSGGRIETSSPHGGAPPSTRADRETSS